MVRDRSTRVKGGADPGVPGGAPPDNVLFSVWLVARSASALLDQTLEPSGLTADEYAIYSLLAKDRAKTPSELARWMAAPATTVSSHVKRFEARGHVDRVPNPDDGRSYLLRLTAAGRRVHRRAAALFAPALDRVTDALGADEETVLVAALRLREAIDTARGAPSD